MRLASVEIEGRVSWGCVTADGFADLGVQVRSRFPDLKAVLKAGFDDFETLVTGAAVVPLEKVTWLPVIPEPEKILCVGLNYEMHRKETGRSEVVHPTIFARFANSQVGHMAPMVRPRVSSQFDFEGELAIVISKGGRYIARERAFDHVAGYACYNDGSIRDYQYHTHQFTPGKNFPGTGAFGPWMVTADEVGDLAGLTISTRLNGEIVQQAKLGEMIFDVPTIIEYCSTFTNLEPGDVIATGTPGGVGAKRNPPLWMKPGDVVEVEIDRVGILRNTITQES